MITIHQLQAEISRFQDRTFPDQGLMPKINHLRHEVDELAKDPNDTAELADCFILLLGIAAKRSISADTLISASHAKMEINKRRKWGPPDADGVCHHIQERA